LPERPVGETEHRVNSLSELNLSGETLDSVLGHIGRLGVEALDGWAVAATTLVEGREVTTYGDTDQRVLPIDQQQYDSRRGPCVDALGGSIEYFNGEDIKPGWRQVAEAAAEAGIYSILSFPLQNREEVIGALNFYSPERDALRPGQREEGSLFAAHAAVTLANTKELLQRGEKAEQLEEALHTRTLIGQATGLLMAQEGMTSEEAFQKLVSVSQHANLKLRDIARKYVQAWEETSSSEPG
jgi:GAF domain-containing protein